MRRSGAGTGTDPATFHVWHTPPMVLGPAAGRLLIATGGLADPNFSRTVVLLLDHDSTGTLGVVLNRPTTLDVAEALPSWAGLVGPPPPVLFQGGPVGLDSALALATL